MKNIYHTVFNAVKELASLIDYCESHGLISTNDLFLRSDNDEDLDDDDLDYEDIVDAMNALYCELWTRRVRQELPDLSVRTESDGGLNINIPSYPGSTDSVAVEVLLDSPFRESLDIDLICFDDHGLDLKQRVIDMFSSEDGFDSKTLFFSVPRSRGIEKLHEIVSRLESMLKS